MHADQLTSNIYDASDGACLCLFDKLMPLSALASAAIDRNIDVSYASQTIECLKDTVWFLSS